jgi:hypothetical protein
LVRTSPVGIMARIGPASIAISPIRPQGEQRLRRWPGPAGKA